MARHSITPVPRQSITFDCGSEFLSYDELTRNHGHAETFSVDRRGDYYPRFYVDHTVRQFIGG